MGRIVDLSKSERPRERLMKYGAKVLSNAELLAIILRTGSKKENIVELSNRVIKESGGLNGLLTSDLEAFRNLYGIGKAKAAQILAVAEISKRFNSYKDGSEYKILKSFDAANLVMSEMSSLKQEHLMTILLNTRNIVICVEDISIGDLNSSIVHPREVFCEAIKKNSASIIVCHNHPSGDPSPSSEDLDITYRLKECGKILGINLLDHLIIGNGKYISLKEKGIL